MSHETSLDPICKWLCVGVYYLECLWTVIHTIMWLCLFFYGTLMHTESHSWCDTAHTRDFSIPLQMLLIYISACPLYTVILHAIGFPIGWMLDWCFECVSSLYFNYANFWQYVVCVLSKKGLHMLLGSSASNNDDIC